MNAAAEGQPPEVNLSPQGLADLELLQRLAGGAHRVAGPRRDPFDDDADWEVELTRTDGRHVWFYGAFPERALERARSWLEWARKHPGRALRSDP